MTKRRRVASRFFDEEAEESETDCNLLNDIFDDSASDLRSFIVDDGESLTDSCQYHVEEGDTTRGRVDGNGGCDDESSVELDVLGGAEMGEEDPEFLSLIRRIHEPVAAQGQGVLDAIASLDQGRSGLLQGPVLAEPLSADADSDLVQFGDVLQDTDAGNFRLQANAIHLTYRGHILPDKLLAVFGVGNIKWYSIVHERGTHKEEGGEPYDHTHFYCRLHQRCNKRGARCCDVEGVHPFIQRINSSIHEGRLFHLYHKKSPISIWQSEEGPKDPTILANKQRLSELIHSGTLLEAATALGIEPRTITDLKAIRQEKSFAPPAASRFPKEAFVFHANWKHVFENKELETCVMYVYGSSGFGKTEWALAQFEKPLLVRHFDRVRDFHPDRYDGIVFDDVSIGHMEWNERILFCDYDQPTEIKARFSNGSIPAYTKRIITSNMTPKEFFGHKLGYPITDDMWRTINRRVKFLHIVFKTYAN